MKHGLELHGMMNHTNSKCETCEEIEKEREKSERHGVECVNNGTRFAIGTNCKSETCRVECVN